jgi:hypothetical protein
MERKAGRVGSEAGERARQAANLHVPGESTLARFAGFLRSKAPEVRIPENRGVAGSIRALAIL